MPMTSPRMLSSGPPELPRLIAASVWIMSSTRVPPPTERDAICGRPTALTTPTVTVFSSVKRIADRHDPVARRHLRGVAELDLGERRARHLGQLEQRGVGQRVAADDLGGRRSSKSRMFESCTSILVASSTTWLLVRM